MGVQTLFSILSLVLGPVLSFFDKIFQYKADTQIAQINADATVEQASIQGTAAVEQRWWFVAALLPAFALPYVIYDTKCVLWDNVFMGGHASTPALHGSLDTINWIIVTGLFMYGFKNAR